MRKAVQNYGEILNIEKEQVAIIDAGKNEREKD